MPGWRERVFRFQVEKVRVEKVFELRDAGGVARFARVLGLDLPDAFASDFKLLADLFEGTTVAVGQSEPLLEDLAFAIAQSIEDIFAFPLKEVVTRSRTKDFIGL